MVGGKVFYETQYVVEQKVPLEFKCKLDKGQLYFSDFFRVTWRVCIDGE